MGGQHGPLHGHYHLVLLGALGRFIQVSAFQIVQWNKPKAPIPALRCRQTLRMMLAKMMVKIRSLVSGSAAIPIGPNWVPCQRVSNSRLMLCPE